MIGVTPVTAAEITANIAKLESALARGETRVQFADRLVEYRSISQLTDAIAYFRGLQVEQSGRGRQSFGVAVKGF
jgi:hypothetical protein